MSTETIELKPVEILPDKPNAAAEVIAETKEAESKATLPDDVVVVTGEEVMRQQNDAIAGISQEEVEARPDDPRGVQKRIKKLSDRAKESNRLYEQKEKENTELRQKLAAISHQQAQQPQAVQRQVVQPAAKIESGEPKQDDFETFDEYTAARVKFVTKQTIKEEIALANEQRRIRSQMEAEQQLSKNFNEQAEQFEKKAPDFKQVAYNPNVPINEVMKAAIMESPKGAEVLYYLGKNPDVAHKIAASDFVVAVKTIGRIEQQFMQTTTGSTKRSSPPKPVTTLGGSSSTVDAPMSEMGYEEYRAHRLSGKS